MPETIRTNPAPASAFADTAALDSRVTALLDEMQQASDRMLRHLDQQAPPAAAPPDPAEHGAQIPFPTVPAPAAATGGSPHTRDELGKAVDQMIADAKAAGRRPAEVEKLDRELATRADDLIEGEIADETRVLATQPPPLSASVAAPARPAPEVPPPPLPPAPAGLQPTVSPPAPEQKPDSTIGPVPAPTPEVPSAAPARAPHRFSLALLTGLARFSAPVAHRPHVRMLVGYLAMWTLFNAGCLFAYNFFVRAPEPPSAPTGGAADGATTRRGPASGGHTPPEHTGSADSHGETDGRTSQPAKPPSKSRSALPKKPASGGGRGGH